MKKFLTMFLAFLIIFNVMFGFPAKSHAITNIIDKPGFLDNAWSSIVTGVVAVSAVAITAYDKIVPDFEEIKEFAKDAYTKVSATTKAAFRASMTLYEQSHIQKVPDIIWNTITSDLGSFVGKKVADFNKSKNIGYEIYNGSKVFQLPSNPGMVVVDAKGVAKTYQLTFLQIQLTDGRERDFITLTMNVLNANSMFSTIHLSESVLPEAQRNFDNIATLSQVFDFLALYNNTGVTYSIDADYIEAIYNPVLKRAMEQDIPRMKDAGLVLPLPEAYTTDNKKLKVKTDTGVMELPDGTIYTGEVDWRAPAISLDKTKTKVGYVETDVVTGDTTWTDITTGEKVKQDPADGGGGGTKPDNPDMKFDLRPLIMLGGLLKEKFPFSIPFDVFNLFSRLNVEPITPIFDFSNAKKIVIGGIKIPVDFDFKIDFSVFDPIAKIMRWGLVLVFDIAIVMALRRLTPD